MRLLFKFNLIFLVVFIAGVLGAGKVSYDLLQSNAKEEVLNHARLTMEKALAVRTYTNDQIMWYIILHMTFVVSAVLLGVLDKMSFAKHREH